MPLAALLAAAAALTWLMSAMVALTAEPRRGTVRTGEAWRAGVYKGVRIWETSASRYVEAVWEAGHRRSWGPEQATGSPDTHGLGDLQTAWASATPDGGDEWLEVRWPFPVEAAEVLIYQTFNPGAIKLVEVADSGGPSETIWRMGDDPGPRPSAGAMGGPEVLAVTLNATRAVDRVIVRIDSAHVPGWNEIDAVCLRDSTGKVVDAVDAVASSTYADQHGRMNGLEPPAWTGLQGTPPRLERGEVAYEARAAAAYGWPMLAWGAAATLDRVQAPWGRGAGAVPAATVSPFARSARPLGPGGVATGAGPARLMRALPWRPVWPGIVVNTAAYAAVLWVAGLVLLRPLRPLRRLARMQRGECPGCGYDVGYDFARGCPECGMMRAGK